MDNSSHPKNPSMAGIGQRLKEAREKKSLAVDQVQKQTHIHSTVLIALEEGRCDQMLTATYVKAFLKQYANYLGIDTSEILKEYSFLHPESAPKISGFAKIDSRPAELKVDLSGVFRVMKKTLVFLSVLLFVVFLSGKAIQFIKKIAANSSKVPQAAKQHMTPSKAAAKPAARKTQTHPKSSARSDQKSESQVSIPKNESLKLLLKAKQPVLVQLKRDGVTIFKRVLPKGTIESINADDSIDIYVAKAEAIELTLNGKPLTIPGKGVIKDIEITRKGIKIK